MGFVGMIRDHDSGRQVVKLEYSAHPSAADGHRRSGCRGRRAIRRDAGCCGQPPDRRPADRRRGAGRRGRRRPSPGGIRHLRTAGGRHQGAVTGVEASDSSPTEPTNGWARLRPRPYQSAGKRRAATSIVLPARSGWARSRTATPSRRNEHRDSTRASSGLRRPALSTSSPTVAPGRTVSCSESDPAAARAAAKYRTVMCDRVARLDRHLSRRSRSSAAPAGRSPGR